MRDSASATPAETKPPPEGGGGISRLNRRHGGGAPTFVVSVSLLLPAFPSAVSDATVAVFERTVPAPAVTFATIVTVMDPPGPRSPARVAVTVPFSPTFGPLQFPRLAAQETKVVPVGSGSFMTVLTATPGPLFVIVSVYVTSVVLGTGSASSTLTIARSAPGGGVGVGVGPGVEVGVGVAGTHGSWYSNGLVAKHPLSVFVTRMLTLPAG
jgi:hypothetical protein